MDDFGNASRISIAAINDFVAYRELQNLEILENLC